VQVEARSLQQAFAEANASLRQANTLIGEYSLVEAEEEPAATAPVIIGEAEAIIEAALTPVVTGANLQQTLTVELLDALGRVQKARIIDESEPDHAPGNGHVTRQASLFAGAESGSVSAHHANGKGVSPIPAQAEPVDGEKPKPPVPRPRLLISS
jgi:hypothetical protein